MSSCIPSKKSIPLTRRTCKGLRPLHPQKAEPRDQKPEIRKQGYPSLRSGRAGTTKTVVIIPVASEVPVTSRTAET